MVKKVSIYLVILIFLVNIITVTNADIKKLNNWFNTTNEIDMDSLLKTDCILTINNLIQKNILDFPNYDPGDLDTPLFDFIELMDDFGQTAWGLSSADFNHDGNNDFVVTYADAPISHTTFSIFYNNGQGIFTKDDVYKFYNYYVKSITSDDFDNDGDIDIIYTYDQANNQSIYIYGFIRIMLNDGTNHFAKTSLIAKRGTVIPYDPDGRINIHVTSADYDMDGDVDLLAGDNSGAVEFYLNEGNANFTSSGILHDYGLLGLTWGLTSADFDGDGDIDVLIAALVRNYFGHIWFKQNMMIESNYSIVFESGPGIIIADINSSYCIQGTASLTSLDYNNDGKMDFIAGISLEAYLYVNKGGFYEPFYICTLPDGTEGYMDDLTFGAMTSADYNKDGCIDVVMGGLQGYVRLLINKHALAVIIRPKNTYWYLFDTEKYPIFRYGTRAVCIGKITLCVAELEDLARVEFYINGKLKYSDNSTPFDYVWRTDLLFRFRYNVKIVAYDAIENHSSSDEIKIWRLL